MTPTARSEKILLKGECGETTWSEEYRLQLKKFIAAQIEEARDEAKREERAYWQEFIRLNYDQH